MTRKELLDFCGSLQGADRFCIPPSQDAVFFRHQRGGKWFAFVHVLEKELCVTLKLDPMEALALHTRFKGVGPGWHMNKLHWNTVIVSQVPSDVVQDMIRSSHALTEKREQTARSRMARTEYEEGRGWRTHC